MTRTALLLGVNRYLDASLSDLRSPRADVDAVEAALKANGHFDRVRALHDPTRDQAVEAVEEILADGRPDDVAFIAFSGHGIKNRRGRLHLAFHDTRRQRLETTALSADTLKRMLADSRVQRIVLLLDCCYSGAFADGFATRAEADDDFDVERQLGQDDSVGTYVLASAGGTQYAVEGDNAERVRPSVFSDAVARGLWGEADDSNGDGWVDNVDLYQFVHRAVDSLGGQRVTGFSLGTQGAIRLARHAGSATSARPDERTIQRVDGVSRQGATTTASGPAGARKSDHAPPPAAAPGPHAPLDTRQWERLLDYHRACVLRQNVLQQLPDLDGGRFEVCEADRETLLSGEAERLTLPPRAAALAAGAIKNQESMRYGYPTVLFDPLRRRGTRRGQTKVAPLIVMDVVAEEDGNGDYLLLPAGPPELNRELLVSAADLDEDEVEEFVTWFRADWGGTGVTGLSDKARTVCGRLGLEQVQDLAAGELSTRLEATRPLRPGARNTAMLYAADPGQGAVKDLLRDLDHRASKAVKPALIGSSALGALAGGAPPAVRAPSIRPVITGLSNAAQERILDSAMSRVLTVATGAPGTGKSELITSVVTTAVTAGQSVLIASTNNAAVDEVVKRANALLPEGDLVVRSGNSEQRAKEGDILTELSAARLETVDSRTAAERLDMHRRALTEDERALAEIAEAERRLAVLAPERGRAVAALPAGVTPEALWAADAPPRWHTRVEAALTRRWTRWWHRWRVRRTLRLDPDDSVLTDLLRFLEIEVEWSRLHARLAALPSPEAVHAHIGRTREARREDSRAHLQGQVAYALESGRAVVEERVRHLATGGNRWTNVRTLLRTVRAWAVTSRSARAFPPEAGLFDLVVVDEAGQCTIADVLPLLYRAKRALVIGDPHQLQPVNGLDAVEDRRLQREAGLDERWLDDRSLAYTRSSAYAAAAAAVARSDGEVLWLDEHYRCHPDIVTPVNRRFYGGRLAVRTRTDALAAPADRAVRWIDVRGRTDRPGGRSCRNAAEAQRVIELLRELWRELPREVTIGVVTPFLAQRRELDRRLGAAGKARIRVGTVHTFQGGECDVMVVSPVAAAGVDRGPGGWAAKQQNLWNVAVTRARSRLYVVGDLRHWSAQNGVLADFAADVAAAPADPPPDEARGRLFAALTRAGARPETGWTVNGYACDLTATTREGDRVAVVVDRCGIGDPAAPGPGRALLRTLDEAALFSAVSAVPTRRVAAWRCLTEPEAVAAELTNGG
ncbi:AAA domain-containing protein [Streptomonospora nanhaiensis]|uniref:AAA domain-containing protein n=1 Tax=Streptomonospora nanhaiensis TaxID=1323731 RepID=UPI001C992AAC|nr:AAA domain-containing protein [Streptomonospora nanhaiensis]MBX9387558.1 caspase family protein [Streptomonospora nanhaiensis]